MGFRDRLAHAWDAFNSRQTNDIFSPAIGYGNRPDRIRRSFGNEKSIVSSVYTTLANDAAAVKILHVRLDEKGRFLEEIDSGLNNCLTLEANVDQAATHFRRDAYYTLFDKGVCALVPVRTSLNPAHSASFNILDMRVGEVVQWGPKHVKVRVYNDETGRFEDITVEKKTVAIVENPFYAVMNEPSSTLQRLIRKLQLLDGVDEASSSGKLDIIIQFPHTIRSDAKRDAAEKRRSDIEFQLKGSQYGIAYLDGTEKITQLNRPSENNLLAQIEFLRNELFTQLGLTPEIMNGTAESTVMLNYMNRTISPLVEAMVEAMRRSFLTKTARTQRQSIAYFRNNLSLLPLSDLAEVADKMTRNEILTSNEVRQIIGMAPSQDPKADTLRNSNMPEKDLGRDAPPSEEEVTV